MDKYRSTARQVPRHSIQNATVCGYCGRFNPGKADVCRYCGAILNKEKS